VIVKYLL